MNERQIKEAVFEAIVRVAPEADPAQIPGSADFREELDIDSMDFLNVVVALHETLGVDIPEVDYPKLVSLDAAVAYLKQKVG